MKSLRIQKQVTLFPKGIHELKSSLRFLRKQNKWSKIYVSNNKLSLSRKVSKQYWKPHWDFWENWINGPKIFSCRSLQMQWPNPGPNSSWFDDELHPAGVVHIRNIIFTRVGHFLFRYQLNKIDSSNITPILHKRIPHLFYRSW